MRLLAASFAGLLFGIGLTISGMVNPAIVLGFLDVAGQWNPALLFVMVGALSAALPGYWLLKGRKPVLAEARQMPTRRDIDWPLILGAILFGVGWGLAGICPGPAIALLAIAPVSALIFLVAMTAGLWLARISQQQ